ncbi:MAG: helix-turn-helix transcriptional regulator [Treponema sp.]|nr:helix-turn-helix transcriptional regulator [Treponema sp.]
MITYIETGKRTPTIKTILKLCNTMRIDPASLFSRSDDDKLTAKRTVLDLIERYM